MDKIDVTLVIQVDTLCHKIPNFIEKAARAGVTRVFIGLENINPANLLGRQEAAEQDHRIPQDAARLEACRRHHLCGLHPRAFQADTPQSIREDIEIIKRELPLDILEFFCLTPLPGSEDHKMLWEKGVWMDPDMNKYDLEHVTTHHARMTREEWEQVYRAAWAAYYTPEHKLTILRRAAAAGMGMSRLLRRAVLRSRSAFPVEKLHPLQVGAFRLKYRPDRRPGLSDRTGVVVLSEAAVGDRLQARAAARSR